ncbi:MAG: cysteine-rich CWC family protein [Flavobacteriales bacterium]|nr:cysteine-rich CWC family protein [Flavobacteriales bacterium]
MPAHEEKYCPRCGGPFICMVGNIAECQCSTVKLDGPQRQHIAERYDDCLCAKCMVEEGREKAMGDLRDDP